MKCLSTTHLITAAMPMVGLTHDVDTPHRLIEEFQRGMGEPTDGGWSIAFVQYAGYAGHFCPVMRASSWPLPRTGNAQRLAEFATEVGVLSEGEPHAGEIFLTWSPARRIFIRGGIVLDAGEPRAYPSGTAYHPCLTIEGDTDSAGMPRGHGVYLVRRNVSVDQGDRMVRWFDLDASGEREIVIETATSAEDDVESAALEVMV
jgi:hypothetical protein